jgi:DNA-binding transcriptional regulator YdaS (Cro superfamily)
MSTTAIKEAISLLGGPVKAAERLCIDRYQTVQHWERSGRVPAKYCPLIERELDGQVVCEQLNADVDWSYVRGTSTESRAAA